MPVNHEKHLLNGGIDKTHQKTGNRFGRWIISCAAAATDTEAVANLDRNPYIEIAWELTVCFCHPTGTYHGNSHAGLWSRV